MENSIQQKIQGIAEKVFWENKDIKVELNNYFPGNKTISILLSGGRNVINDLQVSYANVFQIERFYDLTKNLISYQKNWKEKVNITSVNDSKFTLKIWFELT